MPLAADISQKGNNLNVFDGENEGELIDIIKEQVVNELRKSTPSSSERVTTGTRARPLRSDAGASEVQETHIADMVVSKLMPQMEAAICTAFSTVVDKITDKFNDMFKASVDNLYNKMQQKVLLLAYANDRQEQYTRRESVRINGLQEAEGETENDLRKHVIELAQDIGAQVKDEDISVVHRVGRRGSTRPVICKMTSRRPRTEMLRKAPNLKSKATRVFINEDLTFLRAKLHAYIRELGNLRTAVRDGKILCYQQPNTNNERHEKPVIIETADDLYKLGIDDVDYSKLGLGHFLLTPDYNVSQSL